MNAVLLTGGLGYIGAHVAARLAKAGFAVTVLGRNLHVGGALQRRVERLAGTTIHAVKGSCGDSSLLRSLFFARPPVAVIHLAGSKPTVVNRQSGQVQDFVEAHTTEIVAQEAAHAGVMNMVFISSAAVYGNNALIAQIEEGPTVAQDAYGQLKRHEEHLVAAAFALPDSDRRMAILRCFNVAGAHPSAQIGETLTPGAGVLTHMTARAASKQVFTLLGSQFNTPDGTACRDYVHVEDVAEACVQALTALTSGARSQIVNIGSGRLTSVLELLNTLQEVIGVQVAWRHGPPRNYDLPAYQADMSRAARIWGWRPTRTLEVICQDAWRWQQDQTNRLSHLSSGAN